MEEVACQTWRRKEVAHAEVGGISERFFNFGHGILLFFSFFLFFFLHDIFRRQVATSYLLRFERYFKAAIYMFIFFFAQLHGKILSLFCPIKDKSVLTTNLP